MFICSKCNMKLKSKQALILHEKSCNGIGECLTCGQPLKSGKQKYCTTSCFINRDQNRELTTYQFDDTNLIFKLMKINNPIKGTKYSLCGYCYSRIKKGKSFCDLQCTSLQKSSVLINRWFKGELTGTIKSGYSGFIKTYLRIKYSNKCSRCGWGEKNIHTNSIPLEVEHIDGNAYNNFPNNVTLICPNCQSLTKTYRGANIDNGRRTYLKKYYIKDSRGKTI